MELQIILHSENRYVEIVTYGVADKHGSRNMAETISLTLKKYRYTKVLIDHRNIESVSGETMDIYDRPNIFKIIGVILGIRIAEIVKPENIEHFRFLETVCLNRGYTFSIFHDKQSALEWLLDK